MEESSRDALRVPGTPYPIVQQLGLWSGYSLGVGSVEPRIECLDDGRAAELKQGSARGSHPGSLGQSLAPWATVSSWTPGGEIR